MHTLPMPIRTNRLATLMVVAGVVGSGVTFFKYTLANPDDADAATLQAAQVAPKAGDVCRLAANLMDAADPTMRKTGENLRKANGCRDGR
jgi:hypothetical protein